MAKVSIATKPLVYSTFRYIANTAWNALAEYVDVDVEERSIMFGTGLDAVESDAKAMSIRINGNILVDEMGYTGSECTVQRRVAQIRDDIVIVPYQMLQFNIKLALFQCGCGASFSAVLAQFLLMLDGAIILMLWYGFY